MNIIILTIFLALIIIYIYRKYYQIKSDLLKLPPLVPGKFILGNYYDIDPRRVHLNLSQMGKNYQDLFTIRIFGQNFVVLNSTRAINELLCSRTLECAGRPQSFMLMFATNNFQDLVFSNPNELWHQGRIIFHKFFSEMKRLHDRTYFSEVVFFEQWTDLYENLSQKSSIKNNRVNLKQILYDTQLKLMTTILFGEEVSNNKYMLNKIRYLDRFAKRVITHVYETMLNMQPFSILFGDKAIGNLLRALLIQKDLMKSLFDDNPIPTSTKISVKSLEPESVESVSSLCKCQEVKSTDSLDSNICVKSLLDVFKNLLKTNNNGSANQLSEQQLMNIMTELLFAGVETIVNTVNAAFLYLTKYPKIQEKLFNEINDTKLSVIYLRHKPQLNYTNACILETLRITSHIPLGIFRRTLTDVECFGYVLPEDTILIPNLWKMHHDEELYPKPYEFRPERFLDSNGKLLCSTHERIRNLMPFGCGKRVCPGKNIANNIIFLCLANMLVNFKLTLVGEVNDDPRKFLLQSTLEAEPFEVFIEKRGEVSRSSSSSSCCDGGNDGKNLVSSFDVVKTMTAKSRNAKVSFRQTAKYRRKSSEIKALCTDRMTLVEKIIVRKPNNAENIYLAEEYV
jgi:hypothetical protein